MNDAILVIGAGAIGTLVAGRLALAGQAVMVVGRPQVVAAVRQQGLRISAGGHTAVVLEVQAAGSIAEAIQEQARYRLAVLAVKSYDTAQAVDELLAAAPHPPPVLSLQNGVGNEETLMARLGAGRVLAGVITTPASVLEPGHVAVERPLMRVGVADVPGGEARPLAAAEVAAVFGAAGFETRTYADWRSMKWTKLLMNMLCNASCALLGWPPERVWADSRLADLEVAAWREAMDVMRRQGFGPVNLGGYPLSLLEPLLRTLPPSLLRAPLGRFVVGGRGGKMPSLYLDTAGGKGRTEVQWLNGAVVDAAQKLGLPTPANQVLCESLVAVVEGREPWSAYCDWPQVLVEKWQRARGIT